MSFYNVMNMDGIEYLNQLRLGTGFDTLFADPPDNIGLEYDEHKDKMSDPDYEAMLYKLMMAASGAAKTSYISVNAKWTIMVSTIFSEYLQAAGLSARWLIQGFTFGQHNKTDLANNFRPILRMRWEDAPLFPDAVRIESWRMKNGDKRANPEGRVPGDVWFTDFLQYARVTGNSKQRRAWHPTQLHEGLVEDCLLLSTPPGGTVVDPFAGTGTTLRVCKANGWSCTTCDISKDYCDRIRQENGV